jgi:hypothetical protein
MTQAHLGNQLLESQPAVRACTGPAGVLIDDRDRFRRPAQLDSAITQRVWRAADSVLRST